MGRLLLFLYNRSPSIEASDIDNNIYGVSRVINTHHDEKENSIFYTIVPRAKSIYSSFVIYHKIIIMQFTS